MIRVIALFLIIPFSLGSQVHTIVSSQGKIPKSNHIQISEKVDRSDKILFPIGQSNMDGRALASEWPTDLQDSLAIKWWWHQDDEFQRAIAGWNTSDNGNLIKGDSLVNGLDIALNRYLPFLGGQWYGLKITRGGAPITYFNLEAQDLQGRPGYVVQVDSMFAAQPSLKTATGFFLFLQGETEAHQDEGQLDTSYPEELRRVYRQIRSISGMEKLYGITILINDGLDQNLYPFKSGIRGYQIAVSNEQGQTEYLDPIGLPTSDGVHYTAEAFLEIASQIFDTYLSRHAGRFSIRKNP